MNVSESAGTFMMCLVQRGNAARDYDMNFSIVDVTATAGSGMSYRNTVLVVALIDQCLFVFFCSLC